MNYVAKFIQFFVPNEGNKFRPRLLESRVIFYVVVAVLLVKVLTMAMYMPFPQNIFFADVTKIDLVNLLNKTRTEAGLPQLSENAKLNQAAYLKAQDMVQKNYFSHQSPQGVTPWYWFLQADYHYSYAGENLAIGFVDSPDLVQAWLRSPSHKANMVNPKYTEVGTAVLDGFGSNNSVIVVQLFGSRPPLATPRVTTQKPTPTQKPTQVAESTPTQQPTVLSQTTENLAYTQPQNSVSSSWYFKMLNFVVYQNSRVIEVVAYILLAIIGSCLFGYIVVSFRELEQRLILKPLIMIAVIVTTLAIGPEIFTAAFPDHILILG